MRIFFTALWLSLATGHQQYFLHVLKQSTINPVQVDGAPNSSGHLPLKVIRPDSDTIASLYNGLNLNTEHHAKRLIEPSEEFIKNLVDVEETSEEEQSETEKLNGGAEWRNGEVNGEAELDKWYPNKTDDAKVVRQLEKKQMSDTENEKKKYAEILNHSLNSEKSLIDFLLEAELALNYPMLKQDNRQRLEEEFWAKPKWAKKRSSPQNTDKLSMVEIRKIKLDVTLDVAAIYNSKISWSKFMQAAKGLPDVFLSSWNK